MDTHDMTKALARRFVERSESLKYKGKKRDDAALDYFCGAAVLAEEMGNDAMGGAFSQNLRADDFGTRLYRH